MNKVIIILISLSWLSFLTGMAQSNKTVYLNQSSPGEKPEIFAPGFISTDQFEFSGTFSPSGQEFFFTRRPNYRSSENRIFHTQCIDGKWAEPHLAPFAMDIFEFEPVYSPNGNELYFYSNRQNNRNDLYDGDLWITHKTEEGWSEAEYFKSPVNKKWCMSVSSSLDGTLFFAGSFLGKRGVFNCKPQLGEYLTIEYLPSQINQNDYAHPYISPDKKILIIDAQLLGIGKPEIFISFRCEDGSWSEPINVGPEINLTKTEFSGSLSPDGKYFFFHRRVDNIGNIYWMDATPLYRLKSDE